MERIREWSVVATLWALTVLLITLGYYIPGVVRDLHKTLGTYQESGKQMTKTLSELQGTLGATREAVGTSKQTLEQVRDAAAIFKSAASDNQTYYRQLARQAVGMERALRLTLDRTDRSLNDHVLPDMDAAITAFNLHSSETLDSVTTAGNSLNRQITDPQIAMFINNMNLASLATADTMAHVDKTSVAVEHTVEYYDKKLTTPVGFAKTVAHGVLDVGSKVGSMFAGFK